MQDEIDVQYRILYVFLVLAPRLFVETMFMMKDFNELWAKITFLVRLISIALCILLILTEITLIAVLEDDDLAQKISLPIVITVGAVLIGIDIYFTLMYYQYWKYPGLRESRSDKEPEIELGAETGQYVQYTGNPTITPNVFHQPSGEQAVEQNPSSRPLGTADNQEPAKLVPKMLSQDEMDPKYDEDDVRM